MKQLFLSLMLALLPLAAQADAVETGFNQPNDLYTTIDLGSIYMNYGDCAKVTWLQMQSQVLANIGNYGITKSQFENSYYLEVVGGYGNLPYVQSTNVAPSGALYDNAAANSWWAVRYAIDANGNYVLAQNSPNDDNLSRLSSYTADNNWFGRVWYNPIGNTDDSTNALLWQFDNTDANASNMTTSAYEKMVTAAGVSYSSVGRNTKAFSTVVRFISRNDETSIWVKLVLPVGNINFACGDIKGRDLSKWFDYKQGYRNGTDTIEVYANVPTPVEVNQQTLTVNSFQKDLKEYWMSNQVGLNFNNAVKFNKFTAEGSLSTTFQFRLPKSGENTVDIDADANGEWTVDGLSGNTYTLYLKNNKSEIWAKSNANAGMSGDELICTLTADGIITYKGGSSYGAAADILNLIGMYDATGKNQKSTYLTGHNKRTFAAYVEIKVTDDNYAPIMGKNYFNVRFLRPINVWPAEQEVTAAMNHTEFFNIWEFLYIRDWREYPVVMDGQRQKFGDRYKEGTGLDGKTYRGLGDGSWPYSFYDISNLYVLRNEIRSDAYKAPTDRTKLTDPAMIMELRTVDQIPALTSGNTQFLKIISKNQANDNYSVAGTAGKTASSQTDDVLAYTNNGGTVKPFHIYVPIAVEYPWGTQNTHTQKVWAVITISSEAPEETIDFADANVKTLCVANWDTNSDGELSQAEAAAVTDLGEVFKYNSNITSFDELQYFSGLTGISADAFNGCFNLQSVTLPHGVTSIGDRAFMNCSRLESILIPKSVTSISYSSFINCRSLTSMTVENGNTVYDSRENCNAIIETATNELVTGCKNTVVPNTVTSIASYAFFGCTGLTSLTIPGSVTSIASYAFFNCSGLTSVTIPNSVTFIGNNAFGECTGLTSVIVENPEPVAIYSNTFTNRANATLCVPAGAKTAYAAADYWKDFKGIVEAGTSLCITFADANAKAICVANWDTNGDGELSEAEAAVVTDLGEVFKNNPNITSFDELQYFPELTGISANAFSGCSNLQSVTLPHGVTSIGNRAFMNCSSLESILIPNSVTSIGQGVFQDCSGLTSMTVENGNTVYDSRENCNAIIETATNTLIAGCKNTVIPNTVTSIGEVAFTGCTGLTSVTIPGTVTSIGRFAFNGCSGLTNVTIPGSVTSIGVRAFYGCTGLTYVTVGNPTPVAITEDAFSNRGNITLCVPAGAKTAYAAADYWKDFKGIVETGFSPIIPFVDANVKAICVENWDVDGNGELSEAEAAAVKDLGSVFKNNKDIITFDELQYFSELTSISGHAFDGCSNLQSVTLPHGLTSVGNSFSYCSALASVTIPNSVTSIGSGAFSYCSSLTSIVVESGNTVYDSRENCNAIIKTATNELVAGCNSTVIPAGVTSIAEFAFMGCTGLTSVTIPAGVTSVGTAAFADCSGLTSVIIPVSVTSIAGNAFFNCSGLTSVTVGNPEPIAIYASVFSNRANATLYVPAGAKAAYEAANYWKEFMEIVEVAPLLNINFADANVKALCVANWDTNGDGELSEDEAAAVTDLGDVFKENQNITSFDELQYFSGLTSIGLQAFTICSNLQSVTLPNGLTSIGGMAFWNCTSLTSVTIPSSVTSIGDLAFSCGSNLTSIVVESGNTVYDSRENCNAIIKTATNELVAGCNNTVIPTGVTSIAGHAFVGCSGLTSVAIPNSVTSIGEVAFLGCSGLTSLTIPNSVTSIGLCAFSRCTGLISVTVENPEPIAINASAFENCANATLYVPAGAKAAYEAAGWSGFKEIVEYGVATTDISQMDNVIYIEDTEVRTGSEKTLSVKMKNTAPIRGFQFDLYLPDGVTVVKSDNDRIQGALTPGRLPEGDAHTLTFSEHEGGFVRFLCSSLYNETFTGSDGEIATLKVTVSADMAEGDYAIQMKDVKLTETNIDNYYLTDVVQSKLTVMSYVVGDITGNGTVDVSDYTGVANHIHGNTPNNFNAKAADVNSDGSVDVSDYTGIANIIHTGNIHGNTNSNSARSMDMSDIAGETTASEVTDVTGIDNVIYVEPFTAAKGSQTTISIKMKNTAEIRGFQFDLYLPEGMTAVKYSNGRIQGALTPARLPEYDQHDLTFSEHEGYVRFLCSSQYMETFTGNDGEIATLQVQVADDMEPGDYDVKLTKIKLTENDIYKYYETAQVNTTVTITEAAYTVLDETSTTVPEATSSPVDIKVKRTLKGGEWSTICLPFAMTEAQVKEAFGSDVQLKEFVDYEAEYDDDNNVTGIKVNFEDADLAQYGFEANFPYLIKVSADVSEFTVNSTVEPDESDCYIEYDNGRTGNKKVVYGTFYGTLHAQTTVPEKCLFLSGNKFWYSTGQTKMKAFRGYFEFMDVLSSIDAASARINLSFNGSETTGIRINDNDNVNDNYYDLQGRRVEKPTRGLYIKGNKKVFVK